MTLFRLVLILILAPGALPLEAQSSDFEPARLSNGRPDLNGIWQALNSANYDVERHMARPGERGTSYIQLASRVMHAFS